MDKLMKELSRVGAILTGKHVVYTSGRHGSEYVNKDALYPDAALTFEISKGMAKLAADWEFDIVVAPAMGAIILGQGAAYHLNTGFGKTVLSVYAEKDGEGFVFRRGYGNLVKGRRILIVEDILTTGSSVKKVVAMTRAAGGEVVGVVALCNRGNVTADQIDSPELVSLFTVNLDSWEEKECPLCAKNVPITTEVGKGKEFLAKKTTTAG